MMGHSISACIRKCIFAKNSDRDMQISLCLRDRRAWVRRRYGRGSRKLKLLLPSASGCPRIILDCLIDTTKRVGTFGPMSRIEVVELEVTINFCPNGRATTYAHTYQRYLGTSSFSQAKHPLRRRGCPIPTIPKVLPHLLPHPKRQAPTRIVIRPN